MVPVLTVTCGAPVTQNQPGTAAGSDGQELFEIPERFQPSDLGDLQHWLALLDEYDPAEPPATDLPFGDSSDVTDMSVAALEGVAGGIGILDAEAGGGSSLASRPMVLAMPEGDTPASIQPAEPPEDFQDGQDPGIPGPPGQPRGPDGVPAGSGAPGEARDSSHGIGVGRVARPVGSAAGFADDIAPGENDRPVSNGNGDGTGKDDGAGANGVANGRAGTAAIGSGGRPGNGTVSNGNGNGGIGSESNNGTEVNSNDNGKDAGQSGSNEGAGPRGNAGSQDGEVMVDLTPVATSTATSTPTGTSVAATATSASSPEHGRSAEPIPGTMPAPQSSTDGDPPRGNPGRKLPANGKNQAN